MSLKIAFLKSFPFLPGPNELSAALTISSGVICLSVIPTDKIPNRLQSINTLRQRQNGHNFPDDIFKCIFLKENVRISVNISLKFVPKGPIHNKPALVQIMAWRRPGDKPLSEPMTFNLLRRIYASLGLNELRHQFDFVVNLISTTCCFRNFLIW